MLNLDPAKLLVIAVVVVILLGPDKLPHVARQAGGAWRTFTEFRHKMETEVRKSIPDLPSSQEISRLARSPSALLNHLSTQTDTVQGARTATPDSSPPPTSPVSDEMLEEVAPLLEKPLPEKPLPAETVFSDPNLN